MKFKTFLGMVLAASLVCSMQAMPVKAEETNEGDVAVIVDDEVVDQILFEDLSEQKTILTGNDFISADVLSERFRLDAEPDGAAP